MTTFRRTSKAAAIKSAVITIFVGVINFAAKKVVRKDLGLASSPMKATELFITVGAGVIVHDYALEKKWLGNA